MNSSKSQTDTQTHDEGKTPLIPRIPLHGSTGLDTTTTPKRGDLPVGQQGHMEALTAGLDKLIAAAPETAPEPAKESLFVSFEAMRDHLKERGFPARHINTLGKMTGAGWDKAKELESRATGKDCMLILCGDRGPGKTQIATHWASKIKNTRYFRAHDLMRAIRGEFSDIKADALQAKDTLANAKSCTFLVLDEFSELAGSDYDKRTLTNLLDYRYGEQKSTVIITNTPASLAPDEVGRSVWSRFEETGGIVKCDWKSYRTN